ncbi:MFS transporter [Thermococcus piezophilus]|uniref:Quinolone resistance protein n=1 Tax=Thermococcus piezophilus TaxID=1712654 RepID=A0A172WFI4_9EURY|nr:MFS transporter [Thermococcus piezophilus]ANF22192.1 quinolone resistance protein [Thermococcus piezophilus]
MGKQDIWFLHASTFFFFLGMAVVNPLISPLAINLGADPFIVGTLAAISSIVALVFKPFGGVLGDRGLRFQVMALGSFFGALAGGFYVTSIFLGSLTIFALGRALHGFAMALFFPSSLSTAIDMAPEGRVGETLGWRGMMFSFGNLMGPALGGFVADLLGFQVAFVLTVILSLLAIGFVLIAHSRIKGEVSLRFHERYDKPSYRALLRPFFVAASLALFFMSLAYGGLNTFLPALYKSLGFGTRVFGIYASIMGGASLLTRVIGGKEADRRGPLPVTAVGLGGVLVAYVILTFYTSPPVSYVSAALLGAGFGLAVPSLQMMALASLPRRIRTFGSGIYTMFFDLGYLTGPIVLGYIAQLKGYAAIFPLLPPIMLLSLLIAQLPRFLRTGEEASGG